MGIYYNNGVRSYTRPRVYSGGIGYRVVDQWARPANGRTTTNATIKRPTRRRIGRLLRRQWTESVTPRGFRYRLVLITGRRCGNFTTSINIVGRSVRGIQHVQNTFSIVPSVIIALCMLLLSLICLKSIDPSSFQNNNCGVHFNCTVTSTN